MDAIKSDGSGVRSSAPNTEYHILSFKAESFASASPPRPLSKVIAVRRDIEAAIDNIAP
jgi:hypothetical protein